MIQGRKEKREHREKAAISDSTSPMSFVDTLKIALDHNWLIKPKVCKFTRELALKLSILGKSLGVLISMIENKLLVHKLDSFIKCICKNFYNVKNTHLSLVSNVDPMWFEFLSLKRSYPNEETCKLPDFSNHPLIIHNKPSTGTLITSLNNNRFSPMRFQNHKILL